MTPIELAALAAIVFVAFTIHAVTGFASMITALTLGSVLFPIEEIRPPLVALSVLFNLWFVVWHRTEVAWRVLARHVVPWMGGGAVVGFLLSDFVEGPALRRLFGFFVIVVAGRELLRAWRVARRGTASATAASPPWAWLLGAGVVHGVYATGGPPLVYALTRANLDKSELRATLCAVWVALNTPLTVAYLTRGDIEATGLLSVVAIAPAMVAAIVVGSAIHGRIDAERFRVAVYVVLIMVALGLVSP